MNCLYTAPFLITYLYSVYSASNNGRELWTRLFTGSAIVFFRKHLIQKYTWFKLWFSQTKWSFPPHPGDKLTPKQRDSNQGFQSSFIYDLNLNQPTYRPVHNSLPKSSMLGHLISAGKYEKGVNQKSRSVKHTAQPPPPPSHILGCPIILFLPIFFSEIAFWNKKKKTESGRKKTSNVDNDTEFLFA